MAQQQLPNKPVGATGATLTDGKVTYDFLLAPESLEWSHVGDYAVNNVLDTDKSEARRKFSNSSLSIPRVLFVSQGMNQDVSTAIAQLADWVKSGAILKFTYGATVVNRCHLVKFSHRESQWRSGKCTQAEGNLEFLITREPAAAPTATSATTGTTGATKVTTLTQRERQNTSNKVLAAIKNPAIFKKLGLKGLPKDIKVSTDESGSITLSNVKGFLGNFKLSDLKSQGIIK